MPPALKLDGKGKQRLSEADVTRQVRDFLLLESWRGVRMNVGTSTNLVSGKHVGFGEVGMPDWLFIKYWRDKTWKTGSCFTMWVEMKAPGKRPTAKQLAWHETERARGALVKVVDHFETFRDWYRGVFS